MIVVRRLLSGLMALACLLSNPLLGPDMVLCLGGDGHAAVEMAQNGKCQPGACAPAGLLGGPVKVSRNAHLGKQCDSCVDIPLSQQAALAQCRISQAQRHNVGLSMDDGAIRSSSMYVSHVFRMSRGRSPSNEVCSRVLSHFSSDVLRI